MTKRATVYPERNVYVSCYSRSNGSWHNITEQTETFPKIIARKINIRIKIWKKKEQEQHLFKPNFFLYVHGTLCGWIWTVEEKIKNDNISRHHAYDFVRRIPLTLRSRFQM